jgi:hypothetical protein
MRLDAKINNIKTAKAVASNSSFLAYNTEPKVRTDSEYLLIFIKRNKRKMLII